MEKDKIILELQEKIKIEEVEIAKANRFIPKTNTIIDCFMFNKNLRTCSIDELILMQTFLNSLLQLDKNIKLCDFLVQDYIDDIAGLISKKSIENRKKLLNETKSKLDKLLSEDMKKELELNDIMKSLGV